MVLVFGAVVAILLSLHAGAVVPFIIASAVAGAAQGTTFAGSMRALLAHATAAERAGVLSAIYLISYGCSPRASICAHGFVNAADELRLAHGTGFAGYTVDADPTPEPDATHPPHVTLAPANRAPQTFARQPPTSSGLEHDLRAVVVLVLEHLIALGRILERKVV
jgi:hypothetical protein